MSEALLRCVLLLGALWLPLGVMAAPTPPRPVPSAARPATLPTDRFSVDIVDTLTPAEAQMMHQAGVQLVRYYLSWNQVQPTAQSSYDWSYPDQILSMLAAQNLDVLVLLSGNPGWAASQSAGPVDLVPLSVYYNFVAAAAARYGGAPYTVREWEIYNEEDSTTTWGDEPATYATVLQQDYDLIKAAAPDSAVVMGGLAYDYFTDQGGPFVRSFLLDFLAAGGGTATDAINFHHYNVSPAWTSLDDMLASVRATMANAAIQRPLIWTETGAPSSTQFGGSLAGQAAYVAQVFAGGLGRGINSATWFLLRDFNDPNFGYFNSHGLLYIDDTPKPAYTAYTVASGYLSSTTALRAQTPGEFAGNATATGYSFLRTGGRGLIVAWTENTAAGSESWPAAHVQAVRDVYGQPVTYTVTGGQATVPLSGSPVYIELDKPSRFTDVPLDAWFQPFVESLCEAGAISGYTDATFRPFNNTTRGQLSKMLVLALGWTIDTGAGQVFADVLPTDPFYGVIETAATHGIISGYGCGGPGEPCDAQHRPYFRSSANVTRGQLSKMLTLAKGWTPVAPGPHDFTDVPTTYPLYGFVEAVFQHGVVSGYGDGTFRPGNNATRSQLAKMIVSATGQP